MRGYVQEGVCEGGYVQEEGGVKGGMYRKGVG